MPKPRLTITLPLALSAQQGALAAAFGGPGATAGSGIVTLQFLLAFALASEAAIAFASGGRAVPFTFAAGDILAAFGTGE